MHAAARALFICFVCVCVCVCVCVWCMCVNNRGIFHLIKEVPYPAGGEHVGGPVAYATCRDRGRGGKRELIGWLVVRLNLLIN